MAGKDSDKSEHGRLVSEALEFNQQQLPDEAKQQPMSSAASTSQDDFKAGQLLGGKYTVVEVLGRGKAGVTYKVMTWHATPWSPTSVVPAILRHCLFKLKSSAHDLCLASWAAMFN